MASSGPSPPPGAGQLRGLSHGTADHLDLGAAKAARAAYDGASAPGIPRSRDEIERFLDGLEPVPPGAQT